MLAYIKNLFEDLIDPERVAARKRLNELEIVTNHILPKEQCISEKDKAVRMASLLYACKTVHHIYPSTFTFTDDVFKVSGTDLSSNETKEQATVLIRKGLYLFEECVKAHDKGLINLGCEIRRDDMQKRVHAAQIAEISEPLRKKFN